MRPGDGFTLMGYCCLPPDHEGRCNPRDHMDQFPTPPRCRKPVEIGPKPTDPGEELGYTDPDPEREGQNRYIRENEE